MAKRGVKRLTQDQAISELRKIRGAYSGDPAEMRRQIIGLMVGLLKDTGYKILVAEIGESGILG